MSDLIYSVPLGITYNFLIQKFADILFADLSVNDRFQKTQVLLIVSGVLGIVLAQTIFTYNKRFKNSIVKKGLIIGGIILILYPGFTSWNKINNETKFLLVGVIFGGLLWYSYK